MRKLLNTLYITTPNAYLSKDGNDVVVSIDSEEVFRIPILNIEGIVTFGYMGASPGLMKLCTDNGVSMTFLSPSGRFIGRLQGPVRGNVLLRKAQYDIFNDASKSLRIASLMTAGKIQNQRNVLRRYIRDYGEDSDISKIADYLGTAKDKACKVPDIDALRGIEGDSAAAYFSVFGKLILNQRDDFKFNGRNRRPPKDYVNAMLSFSYILLTNECAAALETVGLDPCLGFMHALRPGRASLALDLIEELRAYLCDRLVLTLINKLQITKNDFIRQGEEGIIFTDSGKKNMIKAWQARKKEEIIHPYLQEKVEIGLIPYIQAMMLAKFIRNDIDDYPVFISK
jgi:CRISPR-associated protein Cas1